MNERQLFEAALERPPLERAAFLDTACAGDAALRQRIEALLQQNEQAGSFLEQAALTGAFSPADSPNEAVGTILAGRYKLLERIGEGGMGAVWMAQQQEPVKRLVAVKLIKAGMDTKQVLARFDAERQALALMDHPNIAKVFDAGSTGEGRPFFVMELVKGVPITAFCDERRLTPRQRLELFVPVCQAIQHAHQKGVIHRDVKPSNVLVALYDDKPVPKVIDFGVAKATGPRLSEDSIHTGFGAVVGTLEYMSPEQAGFNNLDVDTRSDVYSLGVLLYELLAGAPPFSRKTLAKAGMLEMLRVIREQEPPKPSTKLSTAEGLPSLAANRGTEPAQLTALMRGEIDWIVMKALEKDRARRYETANGLARDLQRFLADEPVEACPPSAGYRLRKFARKHRRLLATVTAFVLMLVLGVVVSSWLAARATRAEKQALDNETQALAAAVGEADQRKVAEDKEARARRLWYAASLNLMQLGEQDNQIRGVRDLLASTSDSPDRGFEWYYWQRHCHLEQHRLIGHRDNVTSVSWSPDGKSLATGSQDGTAKVWEAATGRMVRTLRGHAGAVQCVSWSPDGSVLATCSRDGTIKVWEAARDREPRTFKGHTDRVRSVSWSPDGRRLASASDDRTIKVWDLASGKVVRTFEGHERPVWSVTWSPDGQRLASGGGDQETRVWEVATGKVVRELPGDAAIRSVSWSPDGQLLATGAGNGAVRVWAVTDGRLLYSLQKHSSRVGKVSWSPNGQWLATGSHDGTVRLWDAADGRELPFVGRHAHAIHSVSWSPDGQRLATGGEEGTAKVWQVGGEQGQGPVPGPLGRGGFGYYSPDGKLVASWHRDGVLEVCQADSGRGLIRFQAQPGGGSLNWSPDSKRLTTAGYQWVKVWQIVPDLKLLREFPAHTDQVTSAAWSPDGQRLATTSWDGTAKVWDVAGLLEPIHLKGHTGWSFFASWSPDGKQLATGCWDGTARIWDTATGTLLHSLSGHSHWVFRVAWSPDGQRLATGSNDHKVKVWDVASRRELFTLHGHTARIFSVAWSPDGQRLATGSGDGTTKVWETVSGQELLSFGGRSGGVRKVDWLAGGRQLVSLKEDGTVQLWQAATPAEVRAWKDEDREVERLQNLRATRGPHAKGFLQDWLVLAPLPLGPKESVLAGLDRQQLDEAKLQPLAGQAVTYGGQALTWQAYRSPQAVLDFNVMLGRMVANSVAYATCYLDSDRAREVWLQATSDDLAKVYVNGEQVFENRIFATLKALDEVGPVKLKPGVNVLVLKVVNRGGAWEGCVRLVDGEGQPVQGIQARLKP